MKNNNTLTITLKQNGEETVFTNDFVPAKLFQDALKINNDLKHQTEEATMETLCELIDFVVNVFNNQFTAEEVWDGVDIRNLQGELIRIFYEVTMPDVSDIA